MKNMTIAALASLACLAAPLGASADNGTPLTLSWKDGLHVNAEDKSVKISLGAKIQHDWAWLSPDDDLKGDGSAWQDATEFRRVRFSLAGTVRERIEFKTQYDFAGGDVSFKDVYIGVKKVPVLGAVRVGQFKEPMSLEELTSDQNNTFMERALPNAIAPSRQSGVMAANALAEDRFTWALGLFRDSSKQGKGGADGHYNLTGRLTAVPVMTESDTVVHLGLSASLRNPVGDAVDFEAYPESHLAPKLVKTGDLAADQVIVAGLEAAFVGGPVHAQGEFLTAQIDPPSGDSATVNGYYVQAGWFLTGESRPYKASTGTFNRVKPESSFLDGEGWGAWEIAARYSSLDAEDAKDIAGEDAALEALSAVSLALNWYWNPNLRWSVNYIRADQGDAGAADIAQTRIGFDF